MTTMLNEHGSLSPGEHLKFCAWHGCANGAASRPFTLLQDLTDGVLEAPLQHTVLGRLRVTPCAHVTTLDLSIVELQRRVSVFGECKMPIAPGFAMLLRAREGGEHARIGVCAQDKGSPRLR